MQVSLPEARHVYRRLRTWRRTLGSCPQVVEARHQSRVEEELHSCQGVGSPRWAGLPSPPAHNLYPAAGASASSSSSCGMKVKTNQQCLTSHHYSFLTSPCRDEVLSSTRSTLPSSCFLLSLSPTLLAAGLSHSFVLIAVLFSFSALIVACRLRHDPTLLQVMPSNFKLRSIVVTAIFVPHPPVITAVLVRAVLALVVVVLITVVVALILTSLYPFKVLAASRLYFRFYLITVSKKEEGRRVKVKYGWVGRSSS